MNSATRMNDQNFTDVLGQRNAGRKREASEIVSENGRDVCLDFIGAFANAVRYGMAGEHRDNRSCHGESPFHGLNTSGRTLSFGMPVFMVTASTSVGRGLRQPRDQAYSVFLLMEVAEDARPNDPWRFTSALISRMKILLLIFPPFKTST